MYFYYVAMPMITDFLKSEDFTKTQKSRYLENKVLFFLGTKKNFNNYIWRVTLFQKIVAELTLKAK